jgi:hypothetical protein
MNKKVPGILTLLILLLITSCTGAFFPVKKHYNKGVAGQPYDAIIVPGYPYADSPWHAVVKIRVVWATYLYKKGYTKNIIFSGAAVYTPYTESRVMALYAEALGVPREHIYTEEKAEHSTENVYYGYCKARELGFKKVALSTDQFQMSKLTSFIKKYDLDIALLPIVMDTLKTLKRDEPVINDSSAYEPGIIPLYERESFYNRFMGTLGYRIKWCDKDLKKKRFKKKYKDRIQQCEQ